MRSARSRGFTLLELMTSTVITIIILLAVAASFTAVQTVYQREAHLKVSVESARVATAYIERVTRYLGYGIDPRFAIDTDIANIGVGTAVTKKANYVGVATTSTVTTGFVTDDFAFRYRDPSYLRRGSFDGANINLDTFGGSPGTFRLAIQAGRLIQLVCPASPVWVVLKTTAPTVAGDTSVAAVSANVVTNLTSFPAPPVGAAGACLAKTGADAPFLMLVREVRLRIIPLGTAPNIRPYLVAFNSLSEADVGNSAVDFDPIAADVESFHVSYVMNRGPPPPAVPAPLDGAGGDWVLGDAAGDAFKLPTATGVRPTYDLDYTDPLRFTTDVANVRAVTFDLSVRSRREERRSSFAQPRLADDPTAAAAPDGYFHVSVGTTVRTPNLLSRSMFTPPLGPTNLNNWGG